MFHTELNDRLISVRMPFDGQPVFAFSYAFAEFHRIGRTSRHAVIQIMLPRTAQTQSFWRAFRRHTGLDHDNYLVGSFGDSPKMATELADLVVAGIKRATASLVRDYGDGREPMPKPGDFVMMLDGDGRPRFIWRTTEVMLKPLSQVDEAFVWD
jgi:uncharacterized protein YhfF